VIIALKAQSVPANVYQFKPLLTEDTAIVSAVNGIPWWYFHHARTGTAMDDSWVETVDPDGAQWKAFGPERAIGCVVYPACEILEPGVVSHKSGDRFTLGEPDGRRSERAMHLSKLMREGGLRAPVKPRIRDELWIKLWGNCSFNPVSALTGASLDLIGADVACRTVIRDAMIECRKVGEAAGARFTVGIERRIQGGADIVGHKPSTRHDVEQNRPLELDALVCTVLELARRLEIPTPILDTIGALVRMQGQVLGLYERRPEIEDRIVGHYLPAPN
jgi:2-dehydropantoate 2-reductase